MQPKLYSLPTISPSPPQGIKPPSSTTSTVQVLLECLLLAANCCLLLALLQFSAISYSWYSYCCLWLTAACPPAVQCKQLFLLECLLLAANFCLLLALLQCRSVQSIIPATVLAANGCLLLAVLQYTEYTEYSASCAVQCTLWTNLQLVWVQTDTRTT